MTRRSAIEGKLRARGGEWRDFAGMSLAVRFRGDEAEAAAGRQLGLCDLSALPRLGVKGPNADRWLADRQVPVPPGMYASSRSENGLLVVRYARDEFSLQSGFGEDSVAPLEDQLGMGAEGVYRIERQDATFLLTGAQARDVFAQTSGVNFREAEPEKVLFTRVAGVSCGVFPEPVVGVPAWRLWVDYSLAIYLWETLAEIAESLGGHVVGAGGLFPEWR